MIYSWKKFCFDFSSFFGAMYIYWKFYLPRQNIVLNTKTVECYTSFLENSLSSGRSQLLEIGENLLQIDYFIK